MANKTMIVKPVAAAVGIAFVASLAFSSIVVADDNPFASADLDNGYMISELLGSKEFLINSKVKNNNHYDFNMQSFPKQNMLVEQCCHDLL